MTQRTKVPSSYVWGVLRTWQGLAAWLSALAVGVAGIVVVAALHLPGSYEYVGIGVRGALFGLAIAAAAGFCQRRAESHYLADQAVERPTGAPEGR